jgi:DNA-binding transcriptional LysR family regulator
MLALPNGTRFKVLMRDHVADLFVPDLMNRIHAEAPRVKLEILPWQSPLSMAPECLASLDLCISCTTAHLPGFDRHSLFVDTESIAVRRSHPRAAALRQVSAFLEMNQVAVVGQGRSEDPVDEWLRQEGLQRRIGLVVPSYLQALHAAATTDLVAFVPNRLARMLANRLALRVLPPPIDPGTYEEFLFYPRRHQRDPAALWLREMMLATGKRIHGRRGTG